MNNLKKYGVYNMGKYFFQPNTDYFCQVVQEVP